MLILAPNKTSGQHLGLFLRLKRSIMTQERPTDPVEKVPVSEEILRLEHELQTFYQNFHPRVLNGSSEGKTLLDENPQRALTHALDVIKRNNRISEIHTSPQLNRILEKEIWLRGEKVTIGKVYCIDGRLIVRPNESPLVRTWEEAAARIHTTRRVSDKALIPSQTNFCESIGKKVSPKFDLLEIVLAHYDSTNPDHGCAAVNLDRNTLATPVEDLEKKPHPDQREEALAAKKQLENALSPDDIRTILETPIAEEANIIIAEKITLRAITNFYNTRREQAGLPPLKQVGIVALNDTATMGFELRYNGQKLSSADFSNYLKDKLASPKFAKYRNSFTDPEKLIEISKDILDLTTQLITSNENPFFETRDKINQYIENNLSDLSIHQKQGLRFIISRKIAFQYLTGLSHLPENSQPNHPFAKHNEQDISVSEHGHLLGEFDSYQEHFGISPAKESIIRQIKIANIVMDNNGLKTDETRVIFVNTPIHSKDIISGNGLFAQEQARAQNADLFRKIVQDPELCELIKKGKILPIPALIDDETRRVIEIPNHSAYF